MPPRKPSATTGGRMKRPNLYVVARFLGVMNRSDSPMKRTSVQLKLGLNYPKFTAYLEWLVAQRLLAKTVGNGDDSVRIRLTPEGLEAYRRLMEWIKESLDLEDCLDA